MTDKEMLELAAKAAGIEIVGPVEKFIAQPGHFAGGFVVRNDKGGDSIWNPRTDDGDALRLAVKLSLGVMSAAHTQQTCVWRYCQGRDYEQSAQHLDDPCKATRLAITRAAAKIGSELK